MNIQSNNKNYVELKIDFSLHVNNHHDTDDENSRETNTSKDAKSRRIRGRSCACVGEKPHVQFRACKEEENWNAMSSSKLQYMCEASR